MTRSILFVIGDLDVGGAERHLLQILPPLARGNLSPAVYTLTHKGELAPLLEQQGIRVIAPPLSLLTRRLPRNVRRLVSLPLSFAGLLFALLRNRPRIVHFFLPAAYLLGGLTSLLVPLDGRVMSRRSLRDYQSGHQFLAKIERWLHRRMTACLGNSKAVVEQLAEEGIPGDRLGLIYNGIDINLYCSLPDRADLRQSLGLEKEALIMVMVANFIPYKGHEDLLQALSSIRLELPPSWVVLLVGGGTHEGIIRNHANAQGLAQHVRHLGARSDIPQILAAADMGILCSHQEGFSNSVLEGMAAGLPMVVTDVGGNPEAVIDGENGLVVPPKAPGALAAALLSLARDGDRRRQMGVAGQRRVEAQFSNNICVAKYAALYDGLLGKRASSVPDLIEPGA
ncbi:MAG: glycosyltransferase [Alphaproteobacteria bacterium]|nr:glycosyltransferase [Alphaproteobacteria bacterium]